MVIGKKLKKNKGTHLEKIHTEKIQQYNLALHFETQSMNVTEQYNVGIKSTYIDTLSSGTFGFLDRNVLICFEDNTKRIHIKLVQKEIPKCQVNATAKRMQYAVDAVVRQIVTPWTIQERWSGLRTLV